MLDETVHQLERKMVRVDSADAFINELERMFKLCRERGAGTVYTTLKEVLPSNKQAMYSDGTLRRASTGRREGWLARAKMSNKKTRKISVLVSACRQATALELSARPVFRPLPFFNESSFVGVETDLRTHMMSFCTAVIVRVHSLLYHTSIPGATDQRAPTAKPCSSISRAVCTSTVSIGAYNVVGPLNPAGTALITVEPGA